MILPLLSIYGGFGRLDIMNQDTSIPILAIFGSNDIRAEVAEAQKQFFKGPYRAEVLENCGHFLHREQPEKVTNFILEWLEE